MISYEKEFVFLHVPRTAGCSMERVLGGQRADHRFPFDYQRKLGDRWGQFFKFAFFRDPMDRLESIYSLYRDTEGVVAIAKGGSFSDWIWEAYHHKGRMGHWWGVPQYYWIAPEEKVILDFVGRYETLARDWRRVTRRIGVEAKLPRLNARMTITRDLRIDPGAMKIVEEWFAGDFELQSKLGFSTRIKLL